MQKNMTTLTLPDTQKMTLAEQLFFRWFGAKLQPVPIRQADVSEGLPGGHAAVTERVYWKSNHGL